MDTHKVLIIHTNGLLHVVTQMQYNLFMKYVLDGKNELRGSADTAKIDFRVGACAVGQEIVARIPDDDPGPVSRGGEQDLKGRPRSVIVGDFKGCRARASGGWSEGDGEWG